MTLITCPECGRPKVSNKAIACPDCGYNISADFNKNKNSLEEKVEQSEEDKELLRNKRRYEKYISEDTSQGRIEKNLENDKENSEDNISFFDKAFRIGYKSVIGISLLGPAILLGLTGYIMINNHLFNQEKYNKKADVKRGIKDIIRSEDHDISEKIEIINTAIKKDFDYDPKELADICEIFNDKRFYNSTLRIVQRQLKKSIEGDGKESMYDYIKEFQRRDEKDYMNFLSSIETDRDLLKDYKILYDRWKRGNTKKLRDMARIVSLEDVRSYDSYKMFRERYDKSDVYGPYSDEVYKYIKKRFPDEYYEWDGRYEEEKR